MAQELIISISGMRGIIGLNLTAENAAAYGCAFGTFLKSYRQNSLNTNRKLSVCIGRDSRVSGQMLLWAVGAGLCSAGLDVIDIGVVPTPTVGIMTRYLGCAGGVVITASHNPVEYNGIKLILDNGIAPPAGLAEKIRGIYFERSFAPVDSVHCGHITCNDHAQLVHIEKVLKITDPDSIAKRKFRVVLDSVNGAGGQIGRKLLEHLGCTVMPMNSEPTGLFAHTPEPTKQNLVSLCEKVKKEKASIGFAQDPDADRLAIVDENGRYVGEEYTLALAAQNVFSRQKGSAAANLSTSRMIDDIALAAGCTVIRTAVGEANVAEAMTKNSCVIGGEGNGGVIDLRVGPVRDSLVAMALVLQLMADTGSTVSALAGQIGAYYMEKTKFPADADQAGRIIAMARSEFTQAKINTTDGVRFDFPDAWVHLRSSNTEPVMRIIVEAQTSDAVGKYITTLTRIREEVMR